ncbi:nuclear transport factor 2 family protein [Pseudomonas umsongensis]|uniref:nuclear transport factor 2 family protein n=1 Tax=Pseudomonas umsongensis TaxID=198618 RepID=UPI00200B194F|nr:nuclear transport factor 2 family protein [Pseudomonas umsongensis]MCK8682745.1 nuclear transport factor 2 family protein [Pseudomonas umsongensis]
MELIETLVAEREIRHLIARYAQTADDSDIACFAALFTSDGVLALPAKRCVGHAEIEQWLLATLKPGKTRHLFMNPLIEVTSPGQASGSMDMLALRANDEGWLLAATLRYTDRYVHTEQGWKFSERKLQPMMP